MRNSLRWATVVASLLAVLSAAILVHAQAGTPRPTTPAQRTAGTGIVVIDISKVFKEHIRFKQQMDVMKKDVDAFEGFIRQEQQRLAKLAEQRQEFNPGTPDYKKIDEDIARATSDLQVQMQLRKKEFMLREAKLYYNVYNEVTNEITKFADQYGINMVLRYNSDPINPEDRQSVLQGVNRPVVFQRNSDITKIIIDQINRGAGGTNISRPPIPGGGTRNR